MEKKEQKGEIRYSEPKAKKYFVLFKILEFFSVFLFFFGFYSLGQFRLNQGWWMTNLFDVSIPSIESYFEVWVFGLVSFIEILIIFTLIILLLALVYGLVSGWIKLNWYWSRLASENEKDKIKRLNIKVKKKLIREREEKREEENKEKKIKKEFKDRYGYYIGDKVIVIEECSHNGSKGYVKEISKYGDSVHLTNNSYSFYKGGLKKTR